MAKMFPSRQSATVVKFCGGDHNGLLLLLAVQVSYLRMGEVREIRAGGVVAKEGADGV